VTAVTFVPTLPPDMDYTNEPPRSEILITRSLRPFNAEPPVSVLVEYQITPEDLVYCRNHSPVPQLDDREFTLSFSDLGAINLKFTVQELKTLFPKTQVVAALQVRTLLALI
jgi:sulfite oxidase